MVQAISLLTLLRMLTEGKPHLLICVSFRISCHHLMLNFPN